MQVDLAALPSDPALLQQAVRELAAALTTKNAEIEKLHALIKQLQRSQFGRRSEQLDAEQLQLLDQCMELLDLGVLRRQGGSKLAHGLLQKRRVGR